MKIGGFWIRFTGNNSVMNSGGEPVVVSTVVVGLEVVDVALKSLMISFKVLGFSEMYKKIKIQLNLQIMGIPTSFRSNLRKKLKVKKG